MDVLQHGRGRADTTILSRKRLGVDLALADVGERVARDMAGRAGVVDPLRRRRRSAPGTGRPEPPDRGHGERVEPVDLLLHAADDAARVLVEEAVADGDAARTC